MIIQEKESYFRQLIAEYKFTQLADEVSELLNTTHWDAHNLDWRMQCFQFYFEAYQKVADSKNMARIAVQMQDIIEVHDSEISSEMLSKTLISIKTLEEVMDFYNRGGGIGLGIDVPNQTLPSDKLNLTKQEISDIIAFMKALAENPKY